MASQRWFSDMESHQAQPSHSGTEIGDAPAVGDLADNVVSLFAPREDSLAALISAAAGPADPSELRGENELRATFRAAMLEKSRPVRRRPRMAPFAIAAGSVVGLVAGTAGLSAAAVLPPAASHVVAQVLRPLGIDVAPSGTTATPAGRTSASPAQGSNPANAPRSDAASTSVIPIGVAPTITPALAPNHVVLTCDVAVMVKGVATQDEVEITATSQASALKAVPAADRSGCTVNRGDTPATTPSTGTGTGGNGPGSGSGTGSGTSPKNGLNKGRRWHRPAAGHGAKRSGQGGTTKTTGSGGGKGAGSGTASGHGAAKGPRDGTGQPGPTPAAVTSPSGPAATTTQPLDAP
jgi:hypothetical protein